MCKFVLVFIFSLSIYFFSFGRNPFFPVHKQKTERTRVKGIDLLLQAVSETVSGYGAILEKKGERRVVFEGDDPWGYVVRNINMKRVVLEKGGSTFTLSLN